MKNLSSVVRNYLLTDIEMDEYEIATSTTNELFDEVLAYEGYGKHAGNHIRRWVMDLYGIDLTERSSEIRLQEQQAQLGKREAKKWILTDFTAGYYRMVKETLKKYGQMVAAAIKEGNVKEAVYITAAAKNLKRTFQAEVESAEKYIINPDGTGRMRLRM